MSDSCTCCERLRWSAVRYRTARRSATSRAALRRKQACPAQAIYRKLNGKEAISTISTFFLGISTKYSEFPVFPYLGYFGSLFLFPLFPSLHMQESWN